MMQGIRSAIGSLLAVTLVALPATALGQSSDQAVVETDAPVHVTWEGVLDYNFGVDVPEEEFPWGERGHSGVHVSFKASDPRVSGEQIIVSVDDYPAIEADGGRHSLLVRIENADGAWQGPVTGVDLPDYLVVESGWLTGEGDYEGLSFFYSYHDDTASDIHTGQGMIWPGEPPPPPDAALLDADPLD